MAINIIACLTKNHVIGNKGEMPWHLPNDLKHFRKLTFYSVVIMGHKTYLSIGHPLPQRFNIVISRQKGLVIPGCMVAGSLEEALKIAEGQKTEIFIMGGGEIYREAMPFADTMYLTLIDCKTVGDTFFPKFNEDRIKEWVEVEREDITDDPALTCSYSFVKFIRSSELHNPIVEASKEDYNAHGYWCATHNLPYQPASDIAARGMDTLVKEYLNLKSLFFTHLEKGNTEEGEKVYQQISAMSPKDSMALRSLSYQLRQTKLGKQM